MDGLGRIGQEFERFFAEGGANHVESFKLKVAPQPLCEKLIILDEQEPWLLIRFVHRYSTSFLQHHDSR